jgi:hypothetical protein
MQLPPFGVAALTPSQVVAGFEQAVLSGHQVMNHQFPLQKRY